MKLWFNVKPPCVSLADDGNGMSAGSVPAAFAGRIESNMVSSTVGTDKSKDGRGLLDKGQAIRSDSKFNAVAPVLEI